MNKFYKQMSKLVEICYDQLSKNAVVSEYLRGRQISKNTVDNFYLGAFPADLRVLLREFDAEFLKKNGIIYQADKSPFKLYPLVIPICDSHGNFIGIGARTLNEKMMKEYGYPKYRNSMYDKRNHLFGLNTAKDMIRKENTAIVVEGYFDVISSHQAGLKNVISTSGVFLSQQQLLVLARYCFNVKVLFDGDDAGKKATKKFFEKCKIDGLNIKPCVLPTEFKDIDEYIVKNKNYKSILID